MTANEKKEIKTIIKDLLDLREKEIIKNEFLEKPIIVSEEFQGLQDKIIDRNNENTIIAFDIPLVRLNNLLKKSDQFDEILEIEKNMKKIQSKKYITVKEFTEIYSVSKTAQQNYRGRHNDPLPYNQTVRDGKITYVVEEVEKWFDNQYK